MPVEPALILRAEEILAAFSGTKEFEKGGTDLPRIEGDAHKVGLDLERLRARIGAPDLASLEASQPTDAARARVERLIRDGRTLAAAEEQLTRRLQTRVEIRRRAKGGALHIHFHSEEELMRLYDFLTERGEIR